MLDAVTSALAQTVRELEVVVIDDGSTDDSVQRLAQLHDPRLTVQVQANAGLSATLNRGLEQARGRWVKFLPSDDLLHADCIARQLAAAAAAPAARLVFALPEIVDAACVPLADPAPQAWFDCAPADPRAMLRGLLERNFLCAPSALFDRELARAVGGFDVALRIAQDYDLWLKMLAYAPATLLPERLVRVRWHGANQSATVTPASEAERARVVLGALERMGLERWTGLFRDGSGSAADADAGARAGLAAALERSGLHEVAPLVARLRAPAGRARVIAMEQTRRATPRGALGAALRRVAARLGGRAPVPQVRPSIASGPRPEQWLVVAPASDASSHAAQLAAALARCGVAVSLAAPAHGDAVASVAASGVRLVPRQLSALRGMLRERDQRLRIVVLRPEAEVIALAREARLAGARVLYDRTEGWGAVARAAIDSERALIDAADDLIGTTRPIVKQLAASRRLVHLLPPADDGAGWQARAAALRVVAAPPTLTVAVLCAADDDATTIGACLGSLAAARGTQPYRIAVVDDGVAPSVLEDLVAREEAQEITLLRNALHGRASGGNLALRAAPSELVVLLDASRRVLGPSWLDGAVAALLERRALGAVVAHAADVLTGTGWAWLAPRALLTALAGFDEAYDPGSLEDADLAQQLDALGYELAEWSHLAAAPVQTSAAADASPHARRSAERHFRRKWRHAADPP